MAERSQRTDAALRAANTGSTLQLVGWMLLGFDAILAIWVFVGIRSGSYFWLIWVISEGILGLALIAVGARKKARANRELG